MYSYSRELQIIAVMTASHLSHFDPLHAADADMPLGSFYAGLTRFTCPTERKSEVDIDGGALGGLVENIPIPDRGLVLEGEGESQFIDTRGVKIRWSCVAK